MFIPNVYYDLQRSRLCAGLLSCGYIGACIALISLTILPWWLKVVICILCLWHLQKMLYRYAWQKIGAATIRVGQDSAGDWWLLNRDEQLSRAELCGDSLVTRYLIILNFKTLDMQKKISILIFKDTLNEDDFRRLLVRLKTHRSMPNKKLI